jgi:ABC-2 type transport system ATP-binding protein
MQSDLYSKINLATGETNVRFRKLIKQTSLPMLDILQFEKRYQNRLILALEHVSFDAGITWIQGENGSGKSTLFKSIAGLIPADGTIRFSDSVSLRDNPIEFRSRVNYSEAEPLYPSYLSANDLIRFVGRARKATSLQIDQYVDTFGIRSFMRDPCASYSSGMLKKVSLVMAFLGNPSVIILDEPLITLDVESQHILIGLVEKQLITREILFLVSSHQRFETASISTTFAIRNQTLVRI